jgi:class 3 adenylate cyclase
MAIGSWRERFRPKRERILSEFFEPAPDGRLFYVPHGKRGLFSRRTYVVPSRDAAERIAGIHGRCSLAATLLAASLLALAIAALAIDADRAFRLALGAPWLVVPALAICAYGPLFAAPWIAVRLASPLERGPARSYRDFAAARTDAPVAAWALSAFLVAVCASALWLGFTLWGEGSPWLAALVAVPVVGMLPLLGIGPAVSRIRRLRAENARLEAVVAERTAQLREVNRTLELRVQEQVRHIERLGQLKHFFAAPVAEMILNEKGFDPAQVHRRELTALAIDLRGFTAFSEVSEPEEVISVLRIYHAELGIQVNRFGATLEHFAGDGVVVFLNDPLEIPDHPMRALELAIALREAMRPHLREWRGNGFDIGLGVGIATGYATIGAVGYEGRWEYAAIGTVCNLAARLCAEAKDGQIVVSRRFMSRLGDRGDFEPLGERPLKGLTRPVEMFNVRAVRQGCAAES